MKPGDRCMYDVHFGSHRLRCEVELLRRAPISLEPYYDIHPEWIGKIVRINHKNGFDWLSEGSMETFEENLLEEIINPNEILKAII